MMGKNIFSGLCIFVVMLVLMMPLSFALELDYDQEVMSVTMEKVKSFDIEVKKIPIIEGQLTTPVALEDKDEVIITLTRIKDSPSEADFNEFISYKLGDDVNVGLVKGKYSLNAQYFYNGNVTLSRETRHFCKGFTGGWENTGSSFATGAAMTVGVAATYGVIGGSVALGSLTSFAGVVALMNPVGWVAVGAMTAVAAASLFFDSDECMLGTEEDVDIPPLDEPEISMNPAILGGAIGNITITESLYNKDKLTFYVFDAGKPQVVEHFAILSALEELSTINFNLIQPD